MYLPLSIPRVGLDISSYIDRFVGIDVAAKAHTYLQIIATQTTASSNSWQIWTKLTYSA